MNICSVCGKEKDDSQFREYKSGRRWSSCIECDNERSKQWHRNNVKYVASRRDFKWKELIRIHGGACIDCGNSDIRVLQFHHRNGGREFCCSQVTRKMETLIEETSKCDLLCANCHRIRHAGEKERRRQAVNGFDSSASPRVRGKGHGVRSKKVRSDKLDGGYGVV
jgi:hypothetical protein